MSDQKDPLDILIYELKERAKELNCLYEVQELINEPGATKDEICEGIIRAIPPGWQYPDICRAEITFGSSIYQSPDFSETPWVQRADVNVQDETIGGISVYYLEERPAEDEGPFLKEERKLIDTIAEQFGFYVLHQRLKEVFEEEKERERKAEWWVIIELLKRTDPNLLVRISRKMISYLMWNGIKEAEELLDHFSPAYPEERELEANRPFEYLGDNDLLAVSDDVFELAGQHIDGDEILENIQRWIKEDQSGFIVDILVNPGSSLVEISSAIERYHHLAVQGLELSGPREKSILVSLIRRLLSDHPQFIDVAKRFINCDDFYDILQHFIYPIGSHGKLGGKSSGLILAEQILRRSSIEEDFLQQVKTPKTWYLTSDGVFYFMRYNDLEDIVEQKYRDIGQVQQEYPYVVHVFKNASFPPEIVQGLSLVLDDFGDVPLIVRSSSLLEDQVGMAFAGKYKSLFIANQGSKEERLDALKDAIAEVYASTYGPDPIEYRFEHGLIDHHEEMGIMIQEVVGTKVGHYYFPSFAGVAFSNNEFRWSSRIKREDGLIRVVPGLGTRAVDRLSDDYPILISPGQPGLRVNVTLDEVIRYSPKQIDVINLQSKAFETIDIQTLLKEYGREYPNINRLVSILEEDRLRQTSLLGIDFEEDNFVVTLEGLRTRTDFLKQLHLVLNTLQGTFGHPVDIEFAYDGDDFYLLQCRSQSYREDSTPASIPRGIPAEDILFTADRYISNGIVSGVTHIVYVDPQAYGELPNQQDMLAVGRAVGRLNKILPKRQFILMGPGRWGSRGDIKLGVSVTYSDINNTAMLVEIARKQRDYVPDVSFGTHFFQDLVEASIRYLPLYPDESGIIYNEHLLTKSKNIMGDILPDYAYLSNVIRVVDVPGSTNGQNLLILMNAESEEAIAVLAEPIATTELEEKQADLPNRYISTETHWQWRLRSIESVAAQLDAERFGVKGIYVFGSVKNATSGPESDIDVLIHFQGTDAQRKELLTWLEGWSLSLSQINYLRTGYKTDGLLDIHIVTDEDIEKRTSYAVKIGAATDAARPLTMGSDLKNK
jgi:predicted nucleotidyltransferase